jgi:hypothetical protein
MSSVPGAGQPGPIEETTTEVTIGAREVTIRGIALRVTLPEGPWVVRVDNAEPATTQILGPQVLAAADGVEPTYVVVTSHGYVSAADHADDCPHPHPDACTCGGALRGPVADALLEAGRILVRECYDRLSAEGAEARRHEHETVMAETAWMREEGRITVGGSDAGWRIWEWRDGDWHNTSVIATTEQSILPWDPRPVGLWEDMIFLYSIRDPRTADRATSE